MAKYAQTTNVSTSKSRDEMEKLLEKYGATSFMYGTERNIVAIAFEMRERRIRFSFSLPDIKQFSRTPQRGLTRSPAEAREAQDQEIRRLWRSLVLIVKAKLEAIESGVASFDDEMLPYTVLPNNQTVAEWLKPQLIQVYQHGNMPPLLPGVAQTRIIEE